MTIKFTEEEEKWINKIPFNWCIKRNCPDSIRDKLDKKLRMLYGRNYNYENPYMKENTNG